MNNFQTISLKYLRASRTIETVLVSKVDLNKIFFVYNYEGNSFRVFKCKMDLLHFFQDKTESDFHFSTEDDLDQFLSTVKIAE